MQMSASTKQRLNKTSTYEHSEQGDAYPLHETAQIGSRRFDKEVKGILTNEPCSNSCYLQEARML